MDTRVVERYKTIADKNEIDYSRYFPTSNNAFNLFKGPPSETFQICHLQML